MTKDQRDPESLLGLHLGKDGETNCLGQTKG